MDDEIWITLRAPHEAVDGGVLRMSPDIAPQVTLEVERIPASAVADLVGDPTTIATAPDLPTMLIEPLSGAAPAGSAATWGLASIGADASAFDGSGVKVAVLDTGIDETHPAFSGVAITPRDFTGSGVKSGDPHGHGTHCAATIFGRDINGVRVGVARGVTDALAGKVLDAKGRGTALMAMRGLQWAAATRANIVSLSLGISVPVYVERLTAQGIKPKIAAAIGLDRYRRTIRLFDRQLALLGSLAEHGTETLVIAASGNDSERAADPSWVVPAALPASAEGVISVGAVGEDASGLTVAPFSNTLPVLCAPGVNITSAWPGGGLRTISGTSMACPHAAGVAALWWQALGVQATAKTVALRLQGTASTCKLAPGFKHEDIGLGLVKAP